MPARPDLLAKATALAETLGDDYLELVLRMGDMLGNSNPQSRRALRRTVEDFEDGIAGSARITHDPTQRVRKDRVVIDSATGPNAHSIFESPGARSN